MNALVVYASLTGNTEEVANALVLAFKQLNVKVKTLECTQATPKDFLKYDICVVATYTWGREGELPDEIVGFYEELAEVDLSNKVYGTLGSGEEAYGYFCKSADDFDKQFQLTNAVRGADVVKVELNPDEEDIERITDFAKELCEKYKSLQSI